MLQKTAMSAVATLLAAIALSAQPNKNATKKETAAPQKDPPVVLAAPNRQNDGEANTAKPNTDPPASHTPFKDPNWVLVIVGSITCGVIGWQSWETRKAANAARDSIRLQEAGMRQWVNIVPVGISKCVRPDKPGLCEVSLRFEIINKTDYLMTILRIETDVGANVYESSKSVVECNRPLVPQKSDGDSTHPFFAKTLVDSGIWNEKGRIFVVTGSVTYLDCMEIRRSQTFEDLYLGIDDGELQRMKPSGIGKIVEGQQPQKAN
jgi:hypothetical protein